MLIKAALIWCLQQQLFQSDWVLNYRLVHELGLVLFLDFLFLFQVNGSPHIVLIIRSVNQVSFKCQMLVAATLCGSFLLGFILFISMRFGHSVVLFLFYSLLLSSEVCIWRKEVDKYWAQVIMSHCRISRDQAHFVSMLLLAMSPTSFVWPFWISCWVPRAWNETEECIVISSLTILILNVYDLIKNIPKVFVWTCGCVRTQ